jgi:3-hydroxy-9,10-secoandrosta-1,3,5(10)-triene-9,17-dione monooxygenase
MLRVGFEIGRGCASTAWCAMLGNCNSWFTSFWPLEAQLDVWGETPTALLAGTFMPTGKSERADGGYMVEGQWPFASNCDNSEWYFVSAKLPAIEGAAPGVGLFLMPRDALATDHASWQVSGLQGSGSKTLYAERPVFVPDHRVIKVADVMAGNPPGRSVPGNAMAAFGFSTFAAAALVAPLLGSAQGALDWFVEAMKTKSAGRPGAAPVTAAETPNTQERAGRASAAIDAAMSLLMAALTSAEAKVQAGEALTVAERLRVRRAFGFTARQAVDVVNLLFEGAGASSANVDSPIQRHWRDVNAGARHISLDVQAINTVVGQHLLGLTPNGPY